VSTIAPCLYAVINKGFIFIEACLLTLSASRTSASKDSMINPYPANVDKMAVLLPVLANGGWDLILLLNGQGNNKIGRGLI
jgi:hypothetical protein